MVVLTRPSRRNKRPHERSQSSATEQDAHSQHSATGRIDPTAVDGKLTRSHHGKDDPTWPDHEFASLREDGGHQNRVTADVRDTLHHRSEVNEIAQAKRSRSFCVRLTEMHS